LFNMKHFVLYIMLRLYIVQYEALCSVYYVEIVYIVQRERDLKIM
jgi:hypothetical protein